MANITVNFEFPRPDRLADPAQNVDEAMDAIATAHDMMDALFLAHQTAIAGKAAVAHTHEIGGITGLTDALASKMAVSTTFTLAELTDVTGAIAAPDGYLLVKSGSGWVPSSPAAALGAHGHTTAQVTGLDAALTALADNDAALAAQDTAHATAISKRLRFDAAQALSAAERLQGITNLGLFAVATAAGTLDWNHASNSKAGMGETLLLGSAANGPGGPEYYYPLNFVYTPGPTITQMAVPYVPSVAPDVWVRSYYSGAWGAWVRLNGAAPGQVAYFARNTAPVGWLKADGSTLNRTSFAPLFAAIGTTFGAGDGATTFSLPDLRGEFIRSWDNGRGADSGRAFGSWQANSLATHYHAIGAMAGTGGASQSIVRTGTGDSGSFSDSNLTSSTGGSETRPRNVALLACIKF